MAVNFSGKWKEARAENKEATLAAMGIPQEMIKKLESKRNTIEFIHNGDNITSKTINEEGVVVMENTSKLGTPFIPKVPEGIPPVGEMICTLEDGGKVLYVRLTGEGKVPSSRTWIENGQLVAESKLGDATSKVWYDKV